MKQQKSLVYLVTILDDMLGQMTGEFEGSTASAATKEAQEFYASENGCFPEDIQVVKVEVKGGSDK